MGYSYVPNSPKISEDGNASPSYVSLIVVGKT